MIIVTGGAGFIGSCLVKYLNELGFYDIYIVDKLGSDSKWKNLRSLSFADFIDFDDIFNELAKMPAPKFIYHLGAITSTIEMDLDKLMKDNYQFTKELCFFAMRNQSKFVYASSAATYGDGEFGYNDVETELYKLKPLNPYGFSKHLFDLYAQKNNLYLDRRIVGLKYFNVFGPNEEHKGFMHSMILRNYKDFKEQKKVNIFKSYKAEYGDGDQKRDFLYVKNAVKLTYYLATHPASIGGIYNIGSGEATSFNQIVNYLAQALNEPIAINYIDMPEIIRDKYQYYTKASINKLLQTATKKHPLPRLFNLPEAIADYVKFLTTGNLQINN